MKLLVEAFHGFCMALADSVPGVSGGTIAFILGFYDQFIMSLNNIMSKDKEKRKQAFIFLIKLGIGWVIGMIFAVLILTSLFEKEIYKVSSLFIGFIIFSLPLIISEEKQSLKGKYHNIFFTIIGILIVSLITYFNPISSSTNEINIAHMNIGLALYIFLCAMIAISAMVLPGISGSTLLLIFGLYIPIMSAIKEILHFNFRYLLPIIIFGLGVLTGIILVIRFIKIALEKYRSATIYMILGLMIGSVYAIVMGPTTLDVPKDPMSFHTFSFIFFMIGGIIILGLQKTKEYMNKKN